MMARKKQASPRQSIPDSDQEAVAGFAAVVAGAGETPPLSSWVLSQVHVFEVLQAGICIQSLGSSNWNTVSLRCTAVYVLIKTITKPRQREINAIQCRNKRTKIAIGGPIRSSTTNIKQGPSYSPRQKSQATVTLDDFFLILVEPVLALRLLPSSAVDSGSSFDAGDRRAFFRSRTAPCGSISEY